MAGHRRLHPRSHHRLIVRIPHVIKPIAVGAFAAARDAGRFTRR
jgi:hypothetical protein